MSRVIPPSGPPQPPPNSPGEPPGPVLGPIPAEGLPDVPPFRIDHVEELVSPNGLGEIVFLVDGRDITLQPVKLIIACNPHSGSVTRAAVHLQPGSGYVATDPLTLPGNLNDVLGTIALEAGAAMRQNLGARSAKK